MADEDKADKAQHPVDHATSPLHDKADAAASEGKAEPKLDPKPQTDPAGAARRAPDYASEWTASDSRGPLEIAEGEGAESGAFGTPSRPTPTKTDASMREIAETLRRDEHAPASDTAAASAAASSEASPTSSPAAETAATTAHEPERRSPLPLVAGLVIGAIIGAGSAALVYASSGNSSGEDPRLASLSSRLAAVEQRPAADTSGLQAAVADLGTKVAALQKGAGGGAAPNLGPLQQQVAQLQAAVQALKSSASSGGDVQAKLAALESAVAGAKKESTAAQQGMAGIEDRQKQLAGKLLSPGLAVAADSLVQQIDHGQPYAAQVDALTSFGADPAKIAILKQNADKGVPSAKTLAAQFEPLAEPIMATAVKPPANASLADRLKSGMFSMVSVRRADDTSGTDLPSRVARIRAALTHDDVADALAAWSALPADAQAKSAAWGALLKTSAEAMGAARALQHDAIVALAVKKS